MSKYVDAQKNDRSHINTLRFFSGGLLLLLLVAMFVLIGAMSEPEEQRISLPPELTFGAKVTTGKINVWEVYNFAGAVYQRLNLWSNNGEEDYVQNITAYRYLMTPRYISFKYEDYKKRLDRLELSNRTRSLEPLGYYSVDGGCGAYHDKCVVKLGAGRWKVWIDVKIKEYQKGKKTAEPYQIKNLALRVPLLIVVQDDNPQYNPWGLKIEREFVEEIEQIDLDQEYKKYQVHLNAQQKRKEEMKKSEENQQKGQSNGIF